MTAEMPARRGRRGLLGFGSRFFVDDDEGVQYPDLLSQTSLLMPMLVDSEGAMDYEESYEPDDEYTEMGPNARIWKVYLKVCSPLDKEKYERWQNELDVVVVFVSHNCCANGPKS